MSCRLEKQQEYLLIKHMEKEEADHVRWVGDIRFFLPVKVIDCPERQCHVSLWLLCLWLLFSRRQKEQAGKVRLHYPMNSSQWFS